MQNPPNKKPKKPHRNKHIYNQNHPTLLPSIEQQTLLCKKNTFEVTNYDSLCSFNGILLIICTL
jgi:hypothetical protein